MSRRAARRWFLRGSAGAGLALALPPQLGAAPPAPLDLLVITDTHLGYRDQEHARRQWELTAGELARAAGRLIVHLGDVVDGGREAQYAVYREIRDRIGKPVHEIPGNHDPPELFARHLRAALDTVVDVDWLRLILLQNSRPDSHAGFLTPAQLDWLDQRCAEAAREQRLVIVGMHVPAHTNAHPDRGWYVQPRDGQTALYELLARHRPRILALFHGHFHNGLRGWDDHPPCHEICFPSALYNQDRKLQAQGANGYNAPEFRPGYTRVRLSPERLELVYQPVGVEQGWRQELARPGTE